MKNLITLLITSIVLTLAMATVSYAQTYPKVKVTLKNGTMIEGKEGNITEESVSLMVDGAMNTYDLSEVNLIQAKKGKAGKWALGMGGGCLALGLIVTAANPNDDDVGTLVAGSLIWAGIFAGIGALVGALTDSYENVYMNQK